MTESYTGEPLLTKALLEYIDNTSEIIFIKDTDLKYRWASKAFLKLVGLNEPSEVNGKRDSDLFDGHDIAERYSNDDRSFIESGRSFITHIEHMRGKDGESKIYQILKHILSDDSGSVIGFYSVCRDISVRSNPSVEYARVKSDDDIMSKEILIAETNPAICRAIGDALKSDFTVDSVGDGALAAEMALSCKYSLIIVDTNLPGKSGWELLDQIRGEAALERVQVIIINSDNLPESEIRALDSGAADVIGLPFVAKTLLSRVRNIIGREEASIMAEQNRIYELRLRQQENLIRFAEYDELTGIYNRQTFYRKVNEKLAEDPHGKYMIARFDIDGFKMFNDSLGVDAGDKLLRDMASALLSKCGPQSIYAHLEADHFVDFLPDDGRPPEQIFGEVFKWFDAYPADFKLMPRIGVYKIEDRTVNVGIMCDRALLALRSIKGSYSARIAFYDESLRSRLIEEQQLVSEMVSALENGEFILHFQPQYNYDNGALIGAEALVRWAHPQRGILTPAKFLPLFERNGFISTLDEYVWEQSCIYLRRWLDADANYNIPVSVNISRIDLYNPHLCELLHSLVEKYNLPAHMLKLEITESAYIDNPMQLVNVVKKLQSMGFTVEMDDFGSGYSSLNTLKDLPVDILKLDTRFLSSEGDGDSERGGNILSSISRMARWLKLPIIVEGVETRQQADYLQGLGCSYMQGYFFARPMPAEDFEKLTGVKEDETDDSIVAPTDVESDGMMAFWNPSEQMAMVFNNLLGSAAIVEYQNRNLEIIRANDRYFNELRTTRESYMEISTHLQDRFDDANRNLFIERIESAVNMNEDIEFEIQSKPLDGESGNIWLRVRLKLLAKSGISSIFIMMIENITDKKETEHREKTRNDHLLNTILSMNSDSDISDTLLKAIGWNADDTESKR